MLGSGEENVVKDPGSSGARDEELGRPLGSEERRSNREGVDRGVKY